jgi:hypothetical protein
MSGGGGGPIIIRRIAEGHPVTPDDRDELHAIADRNVLRCSRLDAIRVLRILWKYLRA